MGLVKAVLSAGMFPNVVSVVSGKRKAKLRTREDGKVEAHPGSVNAWTGYFPGNWMVYRSASPCLAVCLSACLSVCLSVCLFVVFVLSAIEMDS